LGLGVRRKGFILWGVWFRILEYVHWTFRMFEFRFLGLDFGGFGVLGLWSWEPRVEGLHVRV